MGGDFTKTVGEFAPFAYGKALPQRKRNPLGRVPVFGSNGIVGWHDTPLTNGPTVIIGRKGTVGAVHYSPVPCWPIDTTFFVTGDDPAIVRFKYYALKALGFEHMNADSAVPGLNRDAAHACQLRVPPESEQRAIACILGSLDDKIELNRQINRTLEEMARAIFKSWFIDFDPVRAKAAVRREHPKWTDEQVSRAACPNLKPEIASLFPDSFVDSELGQIPKGWRVRTIGDLAEIVGGSTPRTTEPAYWEGGTHAWATPKDLSKLSVPVLLETERRITDEGLAQISSGLLPVGTVLLSSRAPIGYLAIAELPVAINQGFIAIKPRHGVPNLYLLFWARTAQEEILSRANGSTFLEISKSSFRSIALVAPPPDLLAAYDSYARPLFSRLVSNEREIRTLASVRDALLPKLLSGELRVADAERIAARYA